MRIADHIRVVLALCAAAVATPGLALDGNPVNGAGAALPGVAQSGPAAAGAKNTATSSASLAALEYAADEGESLAQWQLGRMYASGSDGVAHDDLRAFEYFSRIASAHGEDSPSARVAPIVANAFVALGRYYLDGIPNTRVKPDPERAREMFSYAASYFADRDAQYHLARMYLYGIGTSRNLKSGSRWLGLSANKGQHQAQALLGQMLFNGIDLPRQAARGLMLLTLAREGAGADEVWIQDAYNAAFKNASEDDRAMALRMLERWVQGRGN